MNISITHLIESTQRQIDRVAKIVPAFKYIPVIFTLILISAVSTALFGNLVVPFIAVFVSFLLVVIAAIAARSVLIIEVGEADRAASHMVRIAIWAVILGTVLILVWSTLYTSSYFFRWPLNMNEAANPAIGSIVQEGDSEHLDELMAIGYERMAEGNYYGALANFNAVNLRRTNDVRILLGLAQANDLLGKNNVAIEWYQRTRNALNVNPTDIVVGDFSGIIDQAYSVGLIRNGVYDIPERICLSHLSPTNETTSLASTPLLRSEWAAIYATLLLSRDERDDRQKAQSYITDELNRLKKIGISGIGNSMIPVLHNQLGLIEYLLGNVSTAMVQLKQARRLMEGRLHQRYELGTCYANMALVEAHHGNWAEAQEDLEEAASLDTEALHENHPVVAATNRNLVALLISRGTELERAENIIRKCLLVNQQSFPGGHFAIADNRYLLGVVMIEKEESRRAVDELQRAMELFEDLQYESSLLFPVTKNGLGVALMKLNRFSEALSCFESSLDLLKQHHGNETADIATVKRNIKRAQRARNAVESQGNVDHRELDRQDNETVPYNNPYQNSLARKGLLLPSKDVFRFLHPKNVI